MNDELELNDAEFASMLHELVRKIVRKELQEMNIPQSWVGTVMSVGTNNAVVQLAGTTVSLSAKKNKTGETLAVGNEVYLYSPTGELSNSYIDVKK